MAAVSDENYLGVLGPYALIEQIAVGGMAEIYLAKARGVAGFEKFLCLKVIHPNYADDEHFIGMLIDEAKIAVGLNHVNIVQIFDLGRDGKIYFIAMEYIDGADLFKVMRQLSEQDVDVPIDVAAFIAQEICTGLDYAHRKRDEQGRPLNIIHRDISPQNILISAAGEVKIVDFGIAKAASRSRHTQTGVIKGKYYYMSPEQAWGDPMDQRTDIFSTGIILYEVLTGQMLYLEEDTSRLLDMVRKADIPRPSTHRPGIPLQLENVVMKALAKRPADRWQTAHEFQAALTNFLFSYAPAFTPNNVAELLDQALLKREAARPQKAVVRWNKPSTRQVEVEKLMSRVDYQPQTEHSVIFRLEDLARRDAFSAATDAEAEAERTMVTAPPSMFQDMTGAHSMDLQDSWQEVDNSPTLISRSPLLDLPFSRKQPQLPPAPADSAPDIIVPSALPTPSFGPAASGNKLPPLPPTSRRQGLRAAQGGPQAAATGGADAPWPAGPRTSTEPRPGNQPAEAHRQAGQLIRQADQLGEAGSAVAKPSPRPPAGSDSGPRGGWPPAQLPQAQPEWPPQLQPAESGQPQQSAGDWPPAPNWQNQTPAQAPATNWPDQAPAQAPATNWPYQAPAHAPATNWQNQALAQAAATGWPPQAPAQTAATGWPPQAPGQAAATGWPQQAPGQTAATGWPAADGITMPSQAVGDSFLQRRGRAIFVAAMLLCILGAAGALLFYLVPPAEGDGKINVISVPEGASVIFNGRPIPNKTPVLIPVPDTKGTYDIEVHLNDYKVYKKTITFPQGDTSVMELAVLTPIFALLKVDSAPPGADIYIDGEHRGKTPATIDNLTPTSDLRLELRMRGYRPTTETVQWDGRISLEKSFQLQRSR